MAARFFCKGCRTMQDYYGGSLCLACAEAEDGKRDTPMEGSPFALPNIVMKDGEIPITRPGVNMARGVRTSAQQERMYGKMLERTKRQVQRKKREMRTAPKHDADTSLRARIPRELYVARQRQFGKTYWQDEGESALRRDGLILDD